MLHGASKIVRTVCRANGNKLVTNIKKIDYSLYTYALASVTFISLAPVFILLLLPIDNKFHLKQLLALAAGCLLGDAFLHLIPHSEHNFDTHVHHHDHDHDHHDHHDHHEHHHHEDGHHHEHNNAVGLKVLAGIMVFFILEKYIYSMKLESSEKSPKKKSSVDKAKKKKDDDYEDHHHGHIHASGILNLIADFLHNFTDGLAIGASFLSGSKLGLSTTFAIFLHEVPHEIGDYAILIQSGFSKKKAIMLQAVTAIGAVSGCVLSLLVGSHDERANAWILPFTAGGFIYIATVHLIPQLKNSNFKQTVVELICFVIGVGIMYIIDFLEYTVKIKRIKYFSII